jgi:hypothetical protein
MALWAGNYTWSQPTPTSIWMQVAPPSSDQSGCSCNCNLFHIQVDPRAGQIKPLDIECVISLFTSHSILFSRRYWQHYKINHKSQLFYIYQPWSVRTLWVHIVAVSETVEFKKYLWRLIMRLLSVTDQLNILNATLNVIESFWDNTYQRNIIGLEKNMCKPCDTVAGHGYNTPTMSATHVTITRLTRRAEDTLHKVEYQYFLLIPQIIWQFTYWESINGGTVRQNQRRVLQVSHGKKCQLKLGDIQTRVRDDLTAFV